MKLVISQLKFLHENQLINIKTKFWVFLSKLFNSLLIDLLILLALVSSIGKEVINFREHFVTYLFLQLLLVFFDSFISSHHFFRLGGGGIIVWVFFRNVLFEVLEIRRELILINLLLRFLLIDGFVSEVKLSELICIIALVVAIL